MVQSSVSKKLIDCVEFLKSTGAIKSHREFALKVNFVPQNFSQIIKGKRDVTLEMIRSAIDHYNINPSFLFGQSDIMFSTDVSINNSEGVCLSSIPYITESEYDLYIEELISETSKTKLKQFVYKGSNSKSDARIIQIKDNSLMPFIASGDRILTKRISPVRWERLVRNDNIYVVVTTSQIHIAKVTNSLSKDDMLSIQNVDTKYGAEHLERKDIMEIWEITHVLSRWKQHSHEASLTLEQKLIKFQDTVDENGQTIKELNQTIQKMLKQNRSQLSMF